MHTNNPGPLDVEDLTAITKLSHDDNYKYTIIILAIAAMEKNLISEPLNAEGLRQFTTLVHEDKNKYSIIIAAMKKDLIPELDVAALVDLLLLVNCGKLQDDIIKKACFQYSKLKSKAPYIKAAGICQKLKTLALTPREIEPTEEIRKYMLNICADSGFNDVISKLGKEDTTYLHNLKRRFPADELVINFLKNALKSCILDLTWDTEEPTQNSTGTTTLNREEVSTQDTKQNTTQEKEKTGTELRENFVRTIKEKEAHPSVNVYPLVGSTFDMLCEMWAMNP